MTEKAPPGTAVVVLLLAMLFPLASAAGGYLPEKWWPSEWGADDQRGAMNRLTPEKVLAAAKLIEKGVVYDMGRVFEEDMPLFTLTPEDRKYTLTVPGAPSWGPMGENRLVWNEDYISGHIAQDGTQMDSLAHMATVLGDPGDKNSIHYYNGHTQQEIGSGRGLAKLGAEHMLPVFTRGILIDVARYKGRMLERGEEISLADVKGALKQAGLSESDIQPGDAFFYNTGWGSLWKKDNEKFNSGTPGLSIEAGDWLVEKKVLLVGSDNWAVEAIPNPDPKWFAPNHQKFLVFNGIYILENLDFSALLKAGVHRFAFVVAPLPLKGATGSPVRPFAIH